MQTGGDKSLATTKARRRRRHRYETRLVEYLFDPPNLAVLEAYLDSVRMGR